MGWPERARLRASVCTLRSFCANGARGQRLLPGQLLSVPIVGGRWPSPRRFRGFRARWTLTRNSIQG